jgi:ankyrin repeat protein
MIPERTLVNSQTKDGNTVLMWGAWSRSLDVVKFLVRNRAVATITNRNGCSVAHWASSGGGECD